MKNKSSIILIALLVAVVQLGAVIQAGAANVGVHYLGLPRTKSAEIPVLADLLLDGTANPEIAVLYDFNPTAPFTRLNSLVRRVLPKLGSGRKLTVHCYLRFDHTFVNDKGSDKFWKAWATENPDRSQRRIRNAYIQRYRATNAWIKSVERWAKDRGLEEKLDVTIIVELEDVCTIANAGAYAKLVDRIKADQTRRGMKNIRFRRSCLPDNIFRPANVEALELHGKWAAAASSLIPGDYFSPDGYEYPTVADYIADQHRALAAGVSCLWWTSVFNGHPGRPTAPHRRTVDAFTNASTGATERDSLSNVLDAVP